jgi:hypothetical protein
MRRRRNNTNKEPKAYETKTKSVDEVSERAPDSIAAAIRNEEPLPVVMVEMALWGAGMSALMIPIGIMGMLAAPFAAVGNVFRPAPQAT